MAMELEDTLSTAGLSVTRTSCTPTTLRAFYPWPTEDLIRTHLSSLLRLLTADGKIVSIIVRLDGKHVVFGKVIEGIEVLNAIEACGTNSGKPKSKVVISDCGVLDEVNKV